ncbi:MAG: hypothetical protein HRU27_16870, partial [Rhizobiaceae bacterium]|nr:hypothetical protein [Rhizobiaceae bacterium]
MQSSLTGSARAIQHKLPLALQELIVFGLKQANAALFGGLLLAFMLLTTVVEMPWLYR